MKENLFRGLFNRLLHLIARFAPGSTTVRPFLHRLRGVKIHGKVFIGDEVYLENSHPEAIEMYDEAELAPRCTLIAHFRGVGKIILREKAWVGTGCIIIASPKQTLTLGEGSVVAAGTTITKDVPPFTLVGGNPARPLKKVTVPMTLEGTSFEDWKNGLKPLDEV
jgi:acetyltransferase-like isoleucine patch superfamily enzyme